MTTTIGTIDERGLIQNLMTRNGFTKEKALLELGANSIDATPSGRTCNIKFRVERDKIVMRDNAAGMTRERLAYMFSLFRENHAGENTMGVSGVGAKPSLYWLAGKARVKVSTHAEGGDYLVAEVPFDRIFEEGRYTGMITIREMTPTEAAAFGTGTGTEIVFPFSDELKAVIEANFDAPAEGVNPFDRMGVVFGQKDVVFEYSHFETPGVPKTIEKYNYFAHPSTEYYRGILVVPIQFYEKGGEHRFIAEMGGQQWEVAKKTSGYSKDAEPIKASTQGWKHIGTATVKCGIHRHANYFNEESPKLPTAGAKTEAEGDDSTNDSMVTAHIPAESKMLRYTKLVRNGQLIGCIPLPRDVKESTERANGQTKCLYVKVQCHLEYDPVSNQDNPMDHMLCIQMNKNQHAGDAVSEPLKRLLWWIRQQQKERVWTYFEEIVVASVPLPEPDSSEASSEASSVASSVASPVSHPPSPPSASPPTMSIVEIMQEPRRILLQTLVQYMGNNLQRRFTREECDAAIAALFA
jgi:hypothetical protein